MNRFLLAFLLCLTTSLAGCESAPQTPLQSGVVQPEFGDDELRDLIDQVLTFTRNQRELNLKDHAAWQILHGALAYQRDFPVASGTGHETGPQHHDPSHVSAIDHLLAGGEMRGWTIEPGNTDPQSGRTGLRAIVESGSKTGQGHSDQWFAVLAQCELAGDQPIKLGNRQFSMADFVRQVEWDVPRNLEQEFSWTLIGLCSYRPTSHQWTAGDGKSWSIERLMEIELEQELSTSACGGSHRLIGMTMALNAHLANEGELKGIWQQADEKIAQSIETARRFQNPDGSFSAHYFAKRGGITSDLAEDLGVTGHTLEFLSLAMTDEQLRRPWVKRSAWHLAKLFEKTQELDLECGALYHAAHGLALYRLRMFGPRDYSEGSSVAGESLGGAGSSD